MSTRPAQAIEPRDSDRDPRFEMELRQCPEGLHAGFRDYFLYGVRPSGVIAAILMGNLFETHDRADVDTRGQLSRIVQFVIDAFPPRAFGSPAAVAQWARDGGSLGRERTYRRPISEASYRAGRRKSL